MNEFEICLKKRKIVKIKPSIEMIKKRDQKCRIRPCPLKRKLVKERL